MNALDAGVSRFTGKRLIPIYPHESAKTDYNFGPSQVIASGTTVALASGSANDAQTVTVTGTPTGGTFTLSATVNGNTVSTSAIAYNASAATVQAALAALFGAGNVTCTGGALPGTAVVATFGGSFAAQPVPVMTVAANNLTGGTTPAVAVAHTTVGVTAGTVVPYVHGTTGACIGFTEYDVATDAAGAITFGSQAGGEWGSQYLAAPVYYKGDFNTADLVNFDSNSLADLNGRLVAGTTSAGVVHIP